MSSPAYSSNPVESDASGTAGKIKERRKILPSVSDVGDRVPCNCTMRECGLSRKRWAQQRDSGVQQKEAPTQILKGCMGVLGTLELGREFWVEGLRVEVP